MIKKLKLLGKILILIGIFLFFILYFVIPIITIIDVGYRNADIFEGLIFTTFLFWWTYVIPIIIGIILLRLNNKKNQ
jgi:hypothetical protein